MLEKIKNESYSKVLPGQGAPGTAQRGYNLDA